MDIERSDNFIASLGLESYRVGGSVRDELLGRPVKDADYMIRGVGLIDLGKILRTAALPWPNSSVTALSLRDGRQAGWRVSARGLGVLEIVLPRTERARDPLPGENTHRAFDIVIDPSVTLEEDAVRRDFTFNALYKPIPGRDELDIQDPTGRGLYDLAHKLVSTTHRTSFRDDPLRTLRALRFVSVLGYDLSTNARREMEDYSWDVTGLSAKGYASGTVLTEMNKLLMGADAVKALRLARDTGVLGSLFPELVPMLGFDQGSRYHDLTTDEHTFAALETAVHVEAPLRVRWALLFHDSGKPETAWSGKDGRKHYYAPSDAAWKASVSYQKPHYEAVAYGKPVDHEVAGERIWLEAARRIGAPAKLRDEVARLIRAHMVTGSPKPTRVRRMRVEFGDDLLSDLFLHRLCDLTGKGKPNREHVEAISKMELARIDAETKKVPASVRDLEVNGHDMAALGARGKQIGDTLRAVLDEVAVDPSEQRLSRDWQLGRASAFITS